MGNGALEREQGFEVRRARSEIKLKIWRNGHGGRVAKLV